MDTCLEQHCWGWQPTQSPTCQCQGPENGLAVPVARPFLAAAISSPTPNGTSSTSPGLASCICTLGMAKCRSTYTTMSPEPALKQRMNKHLPPFHLPCFLQHFQSHRPAQTIISSGLIPATI